MLKQILNALHVKVLAAGAAGAFVTVVVAIFNANGHALSPDVIAALTTLAAVAAGWLKSSTAVAPQGVDVGDK